MTSFAFMFISGVMLGIELIPQEEETPERGFNWGVVIDLFIIRIVVKNYTVE